MGRARAAQSASARRRAPGATRVSGKLTLWCTSQAPHAHRTLYALVAGLPEHRIRVVSPDIGGGFGNKMPVYPGYLCEIVGSMVTGRPVKWTEDRSENLMSTGFTRDYVMTGAMAATREGKVLGVRVEVIADHGAFNTTAQPTNYPRHSCPSASRPRDRAMRRPSPRSSPIAWHPPRGRRRGARRH